ncbi:uncharacterized protein LOC144452715 [Glandiceps talaboti]
MNPEGAESYSAYRLRYVNKSADDVTSRLSFKDTDTLLDVCCGSGELTKRVVQKSGVRSATAFDINPNMINIAKTRNCADNITYLVGNAGNESSFKPEWKNSFDKALAYFALNWIENWPSTAQWICESMKPGGECFLNIEVDQKPHFFNIINESVCELPQWQEYLQDFVYSHYPLQGNENDFVSALINAGFIDVQCERDKILSFYVFDNDSHSKAFVRTFLDQIQSIPDHLKEDFLEDVFQKAKTKCEKTDDGKEKWPHTVFTATAKKPL